MADTARLYDGMSLDEYRAAKKGGVVLPPEFAPQNPSGVGGATEARPTLLKDDIDVAARAIASGDITKEELYKNTLDVLGKRYNAVMPTEDAEGNQLIWVQGTTKDEPGFTLSVGDSLANIYRKAHQVMSKEAEGQPELATFAQRTATGFKSNRGAINYLKRKLPRGTQVIPDLDDQGNVTNDIIIKKPGEPSQYYDKDTFNVNDVADLFGEAPEAALGTFFAIKGALLGGGTPASIPLAIAGGSAGSALGEATKQTIGAILPGDDEMTIGERFTEVGKGALRGGVGEALGIPLAAVGRGIVRKGPQIAKKAYGFLPEAVPGVQRAREAAAESGITKPIEDELIREAKGLGVRGKAAERYRIGREAEEHVRTMVPGESKSFSLDAAELTGNPEAYAIKRTVAQTPGKVNLMSEARRNQINFAAKATDALVDRIAANPDDLGKGYVGDSLYNALNGYAKQVIKARSENAGSLYKAMSEAGDGIRNVRTNATRDALKSAMRGALFQPKLNIGAKNVLDTIESLSTKTGRITIDDMQKLRSAFVDMAYHGDETIVEGLSMRAKKRLSRSVLDGIDKDLDVTANSIQGKAATLLKKANSAWREASKPINELETAAVKRILKLGQSGKPEAIINVLRGMGRKEFRGTMDLVGKINPEVAADTKAMLIADVIERGGHKVSRSALGKELEDVSLRSDLKPGRMVQAIRRNEDLIDDILGGNQKHIKDLKSVFVVMDRIAGGPGWGDSGTSANLIMQLSQRLRGGGPIAKITQITEDLIKKRVLSTDAIERLIATPEGAANARVLLDALMKRNPTWFTKENSRRILGAMGRVALELEYAGPDQQLQVERSVVPQ
jgi:hypothetical protein